MINSKDKKWFIVQIKKNSYGLAIRNLERQGIETFLPKMTVTNRKNNTFIVNEVYVFNGYIFVSFDPKFIKWNTINNTYGVSKILSFNNRPAEISSDLVLELKNRYNLNKIQSENIRLQKGDVIKMYAGPFADFLAKVEIVDKEKRIWVLLEYAGKKQMLKLENTDNGFYNKV